VAFHETFDCLYWSVEHESGVMVRVSVLVRFMAMGNVIVMVMV